jgi:hypothetical protein
LLTHRQRLPVRPWPLCARARPSVWPVMCGAPPAPTETALVLSVNRAPRFLAQLVFRRRGGSGSGRNHHMSTLTHMFAVPWGHAGLSAAADALPCSAPASRCASPSAAGCARAETVSPTSLAPCSPPAVLLQRRIGARRLHLFQRSGEALDQHVLQPRRTHVSVHGGLQTAQQWVPPTSAIVVLLLVALHSAALRCAAGVVGRGAQQTAPRGRTSLIDKLAERAALATALGHGQCMELEPRLLRQLQAPSPLAIRARAVDKRSRTPGRMHHQLRASPARAVRCGLAPYAPHARSPLPRRQSHGTTHECRGT